MAIAMVTIITVTVITRQIPMMKIITMITQTTVMIIQTTAMMTIMVIRTRNKKFA